MNPLTRWSRMGTRGRVAVALGLLLAWIVVRHTVSGMDGRFFQFSVAGVKGLALYMIGDYSGAAAGYRAHFRARYAYERTALDPAWDALLRGDLPAAEALSNQALARDPSAPGPLLTLAEIALERQAEPRALEHLRRVLAQWPDQFDALLLASVARGRTGAYGEAIDLLNRALRTNRVETRVTSFLQALRTTGDLARLPEGVRPACLLAHYHRYLRIFDRSHARVAIRYARAAIAARDRPADAYLTLGIVFDKQGKRDEALSALSHAIQIDPRHGEALRWAAILHGRRGNLLDEYRMIKAAFETAPEDAHYVNHFDHVLLEKLGDAHQAMDVWQKALAVTPTNVRALDRLGYVHGFLGQHDRAAEFYSRALSLEPRNPALHEGLGYALARLKRASEAIEAYRAAATIDPLRPGPHAGLAYVHHQTGRHRDAIREYEEALRLGERDPNVRAQLCSLYHFTTSEFQRAADCLRAVLERDRNNSLARRLLPETLENLRLGRGK